jgi:hypothetical protein
MPFEDGARLRLAGLRRQSAGFGFAKTDHFIICSNFRASANKA